LTSPSLWSEIDTANLDPRSAVEILRRSRLQPLDLSLYYNKYSDKPLFDIANTWLCGPQYRRISSLTLCDMGRIDGKNVLTLLSEEMPLLRSLFMSYSDDIEVMPVSEYSLIPVDFLASRPPQCLESVSFSGYVFSSWSKLFVSPNLTDLTICFENPLPTHLPTVGRLKDLLSSLTQLQHLHLQDVVPNNPESDISYQIRLASSLKSVFLDGVYLGNQTASFWTHLIVPSFAQIILNFGNPVNQHAELAVHHLRNLFTENQPHEFVASPNSMKFYPHERQRRTEKRKRSLPHRFAPIFLPTGDSGSSQIGISFNRSRFTGVPIDLTPTFSHFAEEFSELRAVDLTMDISTWLNDKEMWLDVFGNASKVRRFHFASESSVTLLALSRYESTPNKTPTSLPTASFAEFPLFPALEILVISSPLYTRLADRMDAFSGQLLHLLQVRREYGVAIQEVIIDSYFAKYDFWRSIKKEVLVTVL
jgi:hypothetical protein